MPYRRTRTNSVPSPPSAQPRDVRPLNIKVRACLAKVIASCKNAAKWREKATEVYGIDAGEVEEMSAQDCVDRIMMAFLEAGDEDDGEEDN